MIKIGIIGCGGWGKNYIRVFNELEGSTVDTCCDADLSRLQALKQLHPSLNLSQDYEEICGNKNIDAVVVATPAASHYEIAKKCLEAGKHILVEKPFTTKSWEAEELIAIAEKNKKVILVGYIMEYHPALNKLKEYIKSGELGDIYYIYTNRTNLGMLRPDVSVMWDLACHDISTILYLLESEPHSISAKGQSYLLNDIEDVVFLTLNFPNKVIANIHASWLDPNKTRKTTVVGSKKMAIFDDLASSEELKIIDKGISLQDFSDFGEFQVAYKHGDIHIPEIKMSEPLKNQCRHFLECINLRQKPKTDGIRGLQVVKILEESERLIRRVKNV